MKLNLTDDDKDVELPENNHVLPILLTCTVLGFVSNLLMSGNQFYALGATVGGLIISGIGGLIASFFTKKWIYVFAVVWLLGFLGGLSEFVRR